MKIIYINKNNIYDVYIVYNVCVYFKYILKLYILTMKEIYGTPEKVSISHDSHDQSENDEENCS